MGRGVRARVNDNLWEIRAQRGRCSLNELCVVEFFLDKLD